MVRPSATSTIWRWAVGTWVAAAAPRILATLLAERGERDRLQGDARASTARRSPCVTRPATGCTPGRGATQGGAGRAARPRSSSPHPARRRPGRAMSGLPRGVARTAQAPASSRRLVDLLRRRAALGVAVPRAASVPFWSDLFRPGPSTPAPGVRHLPRAAPRPSRFFGKRELPPAARRGPGENVGINLDPSHLLCGRESTRLSVDRGGHADSIGFAHGKDTLLHPDRIRTHGVLDRAPLSHRPRDGPPGTFVAVGDGPPPRSASGGRGLLGALPREAGYDGRGLDRARGSAEDDAGKSSKSRRRRRNAPRPRFG